MGPVRFLVRLAGPSFIMPAFDTYGGDTQTLADTIDRTKDPESSSGEEAVVTDCGMAATYPERETSVTLVDNEIAGAPVLEITRTRISVIETKVSIQAAEPGYRLLKIWLVDSGTPSDQESLAIPDTPGISSWISLTDATGFFEFTIRHAGAAHVWYLCAVAIGETAETPESLTWS